MKFIQTAVTRRVTTSMVYALTALLGLIAWNSLPREFMPSLAFPQLSVVTAYPNASSQEIENLVTKVIEEASGTVKGVRRLHSVSKEGISVVTVEFQWGVNMDFASLNLREKIDLIKMKLPRDAGEPRIERYNPFELPVVVLSVSGQRPPQDLLRAARRPVAELLEKIPGVAVVSLTGGLEREIQVELDQDQLSAHHLPIADVVQAIGDGNITYPAGNVKDETYEYVVRIDGSIQAPTDLENVIVKVDREKRLPSSPQQRGQKDAQPGAKAPEGDYGGSQVIKLGTLGVVRDGFREVTSFSRYDGQDNVSLAVIKQGEANIVQVAERVKARLPHLRGLLPAGVHLDLIYDQSVFIQQGIREMINAGLLGALLAFIVLYLFLGSVRQALIVGAAIPTSVLATLFLMHVNGITLNTVSLAGLAVGIGLLVDGAIVVIENITRHQEQGATPEAAAIQGASEMLGAVAGSIGTTVVVFLPLVFVLGIVGQVFRDLSWAIVYSQLASLAVAFTLVPMLSGAWGRASGPRPAWQAPALHFAGRVNRALQSLLTLALRAPGKTLVLCLGGLGLSLALLATLPTTLFPKIDQDQFIINLTMPVGTPVEATNTASLAVERELRRTPEVLHTTVSVGSLPQEGLQPLTATQAQIVVSLKPERRKKSEDILQALQTALAAQDLGGGEINYAQNDSGIGALAGSSDPVVIEIKGYDLHEAKQINDEVMARLQALPGIVNVKTSLSLNAPEIGIQVRRDPAAGFGLSVSDLAKSLITAVRGTVASKYREEGKEIDIRVRLREDQRNSQAALGSLMIRSPLELTVPLEAVAGVVPALGPNEIKRVDQQRTVVVTAGLFKKNLDDLKPAIAAILASLRQAHPDFTLELAGEAAQVAESFASLTTILLLSLVLVFMIMAALFESLWQPLLILLTIPLAVIGMAPALWLSGHALSAMAGMGMVLLCGIVVNNGIVLLDFVNERRRQGIPLREALAEASRVRLRPIVMTAATTILGLLPLALGLGKGSQMQAPMAVVVVAGLFIATLLTLIVLPAMTLFAEETVISRFRRAEAISPDVPPAPQAHPSRRIPEAPKPKRPGRKTQEGKSKP